MYVVTDVSLLSSLLRHTGQSALSTEMSLTLRVFSTSTLTDSVAVLPMSGVPSRTRAPREPPHAPGAQLRGTRAGGCGQFRLGLSNAEASAASLSKTERSAGRRFSKLACRSFAETRALEACSVAVCHA